MPRNYYDVLKVKKGDSPDVIKKAYRKLAKENHPDLHPGERAAEERFKEIGQAWDTLGDQQKRAAYDQELERGNKGEGKPLKAPIGKVDLQDMMRGFERYFSAESIGVHPSGKKTDPVDATAMFEQFMGMKKPGKK